MPQIPGESNDEYYERIRVLGADDLSAKDAAFIKQYQAAMRPPRPRPVKAKGREADPEPATDLLDKGKGRAVDPELATDPGKKKKGQVGAGTVARRKATTPASTQSSTASDDASSETRSSKRDRAGTITRASPGRSKKPRTDDDDGDESMPDAPPASARIPPRAAPARAGPSTFRPASTVMTSNKSPAPTLSKSAAEPVGRVLLNPLPVRGNPSLCLILLILSSAKGACACPSPA
jgi:hypothetical protein